MYKSQMRKFYWAGISWMDYNVGELLRVISADFC